MPKQRAGTADQKTAYALTQDVKGTSILDAKLDEVIQLKLVGASDQAIASRLDVARSTVTKFVGKAMVRKQIEQAQHELIVGAVRQAATGARSAINVFMYGIDMTNDVPYALRLRAASEITRLVGIERMAAAIDGHAEAVGEFSATVEQLRSKAQLMETRIVEAEAHEMPQALKAVGE